MIDSLCKDISLRSHISAHMATVVWLIEEVEEALRKAGY